MLGRTSVLRTRLNIRGAFTCTRFVARNQVCRSVPVLVQRFSTSKVGDDGSHSDFAPKKKAPETSENDELQAFLDKAVKEHDVLLFMKGTPQNPRCGFSMRVVKILQTEGIDFSSADVLSSDEIREGIKAYSQWPTIPQLFVGGQFIGGCDIVSEMHQDGELTTLLAPYKKKQNAE